MPDKDEKKSREADRLICSIMVCRKKIRHYIWRINTPLPEQ